MDNDFADFAYPLIKTEAELIDCGNASINEEIEESYYTLLLKKAYTCAIICDGKTYGYFMFHFKSISNETVSNLVDRYEESSIALEYTAIHLKFIAVDKNFQNNGIATIALKSFISKIIKHWAKIFPIRVITLDAVPEHHNLYKRIGFKDFPGKCFDGYVYKMYMDCMDSIDYDTINGYEEKYMEERM